MANVVAESFDKTFDLFLGLRSQRDKAEAHKDLMEYRHRTARLGEADLQFRRVKARRDAEINRETNRINRINADAATTLADVKVKQQDAAEQGVAKTDREEGAERTIKIYSQYKFNNKSLLNMDDPNQGVSLNRDVLIEAWQANEPWAKELVLESLRENLILDESVAGRGFSIGRIEPTRRVGEELAGMTIGDQRFYRPPRELGGNVRGAITSDLASAVRPGKRGEQLYTAIGAYGDDGSEAPLTVTGSPGDNAELAELTLTQMANLVARNFTRRVLDTNVGSNILYELGLTNEILSAQDIKEQTDSAALEGEISTAVNGIAKASNTPGFQRGIEALFLDLEPGSQEYRDTLLRVATDLEPYGVEIPESLRADAPDTIYGDRGESIGLVDDMPDMDQLRDIFGDRQVDKWELDAGASLLSDETLFQEGGRIGPMIKAFRRETATAPERAIITQRDKVLKLDREISGHLETLENFKLNPKQRTSTEKLLNTAVTNRAEAVTNGNTRVMELVKKEISLAENTLSKATGKAKELAQAKVDQLQTEFNELTKAGVRTPAMETKAYKELENKIFSQEELESKLTEVNPEFATEVLARTEKLVASGELKISGQDEAALLKVVKELRVEPNLDDLVSKVPNKEALLSMVISAATEKDQTIRGTKFTAMQNYIETGRLSMSAKDLTDATTARITEARQGTTATASLVRAVTESWTEARLYLEQQTTLSTAERDRYEDQVQAAAKFSSSVLGMGTVNKDGDLVANENDELNLREQISKMTHKQASRKISEAITSLKNESQKYLGPVDPNTGVQTPTNPQALKILNEATNTFLSLYVQKMIANAPGLRWFNDYQLNDPHLQHIRYNKGSDEFIFSGPSGRKGNAVPREDIAQGNAYIADMLMLKVGLNEILRTGTDE